MNFRLALVAGFFLIPSPPSVADEGSLPFDLHAQATYLRQFKPSIASPYAGTNSLSGGREWGYTFSSTLYFGARLGSTELYFNPEFVQGRALSDLHGLGGFTNGENQRGASLELRGYRARLFARHVWNLGGEVEEQKSEANQVKASYSAERLVLTAGNVSALDIFDVMDYSHDPRTQFMNWASLTYGAWDYPADARGYTWGAALEYITPRYQVRAGRFLVPVESNGLKLDSAYLQRYSDAAELELPSRIAGRPATLRFLAFRSRVNSGAFADASALAAGSGQPPDITAVRHPQSKVGVAAGLQVELTDYVGAYARAAWNDGKTETFMFTEIDRSLAAGVLLKGGLWGRGGDSVGVATYLNGLSPAHRNYLAAGGTAFFLGDGRLNYGAERIVEAFYSLEVTKGTSLSAGYQRISNPGYNRDRGPAGIYAVRAHWEF